MRETSTFLIMEDLLDYIPASNGDLYQFCQEVIKPRVTMRSVDCKTAIGKSVLVNFRNEGLIELATDLPLTSVRLGELIALGNKFVAVRDTYSCTSPNGICQKCYVGTYVNRVAPAVGATIRLDPEYNYKTDLFIGNNLRSVFTLSQTPSQYTEVLVYFDGVIQNSGYTITGSTLTFNTAPALNVVIVVKFLKSLTQPFIGWLAQTYTGDLLGMELLVTDVLHIRPSLAQTLYTDEEFGLALRQLELYKSITSNYLDYAENIHDRLEKAIYIAILYSLYANVNT
jgi:hypothetical protein